MDGRYGYSETRVAVPGGLASSGFFPKKKPPRIPSTGDIITLVSLYSVFDSSLNKILGVPHPFAHFANGWESMDDRFGCEQ